ncbi:hypothetical protein M431DRAFT_268489 [Trichoderma harzianum CBS 226.95]|uniref:Transposase Tc1-like domain-containing protein n=1 Tax=Trichoderma harzianum CBS 226.95 TaxID=983964 RepID=A0A2T3ZYP8_TRIHA|nr:hypothetical protein M431DRAFT_268489 [Trichoderma harzianum CBS 226.95]PTB49898.1 hypothetical protein M431DRAFT_268489 [Trichoderma harzianum CBS 226.95]
MPNLIAAAGLAVSRQTITQYLQAEGVYHQRTLRRPLLTPEAAQKRLEFALAHYNQPASFWRR